ncbi:isopentenyl-diphosphate delta-isomerase [Nitrincola sp. A-D6]|uniref:type 2 isopentenyl-diphosphate Delta-isomerase n=1 Tax=Nitrincola sp. A-D6 TaxID=1545442 RepID=UPI00051FC23C|nr:type 2 isopentenyl-diphosphate Delta-isomerase [Nitrincola sp. A-D6]KGK42446.1 isopentenyl-diphosphate delta-isomerase [Nitrincola sp. A-D6]KGK43231.1 isopentenyl-diphosphate delta-isomerase [Nitrincola sp. A-D6]
MSDQTNARKIEHIRAIEQDALTDRQGNWFDRIRLTHRALPELALNQIDSSCHFLGKSLSFPLLISSMTGGDHELVRCINQNLAEAAERCQVAMGVGSQRVMFSSPEARESFALRRFAPTTVLIANIGAVQLNYGMTHTQIQQAINVLEADALFLHLNPLQEAVQPEGDTNFSGLTESIGLLQSRLQVPIILKEVGAGLSCADIQAGLEQKIRFFDLAGSGGTSWSRIEHHRRLDPDADIGLKFQDWGLPTPLALRQAEPFLDSATLIASGGIRDGIDMVKSVILGASLCGVAAPLLQPAMESADAVVAAIQKLRREYVTAMFLLGIPNTAALFRNKALIVEER